MLPHSVAYPSESQKLDLRPSAMPKLHARWSMLRTRMYLFEVFGYTVRHKNLKELAFWFQACSNVRELLAQWYLSHTGCVAFRYWLPHLQ